MLPTGSVGGGNVPTLEENKSLTSMGAVMGRGGERVRLMDSLIDVHCNLTLGLEQFFWSES